jgi:hypothetical protein
VAEKIPDVVQFSAGFEQTTRELSTQVIEMQIANGGALTCVRQAVLTDEIFWPISSPNTNATGGKSSPSGSVRNLSRSAAKRLMLRAPTQHADSLEIGQRRAAITADAEHADNHTTASLSRRSSRS